MTVPLQRHLVWFRNDMRLDDHPALTHACQQARHDYTAVEAVYIATPGQWAEHDESAAKNALRADALISLQAQLASIGIPLTLLSVDRFTDVPARLLAFMQQHHCQHLWFNEDIPWNEQRRDEQVGAALAQQGLTAHPCPADMIVTTPVLNQQGEPFKVFTAYYKAWLKQVVAQQIQPWPAPAAATALTSPTPLAPDWTEHYPHPAYRQDLWLCDEPRVRDALTRFCQAKLFDYPHQRDFPARAGTSTLSPYLAIGLLGPRRCLAEVQQHAALHGRDWRDSDWLRELAWRDFYRHLMQHFPHLSKQQPFKPDTAGIRWLENDDGFHAWTTGTTGFPIVDAGMRQLRQTGWMHNRLRMIVASFFTKLLFLDWRKGERFFMTQLIDGDFPSNNGGWQWSASTGCDAAPYFRVFNPTRQSERFDPEGTFIQRFVPELAGLPAKEIHAPSTATREATGYPLPIVDYKTARQRAIDMFKRETAR